MIAAIGEFAEYEKKTKLHIPQCLPRTFYEGHGPSKLHRYRSPPFVHWCAPPLPETHAATQKHVFRKQCAHRTTFTIMDRSCSVIAPCRMRSVSSSSAALSPLPPTIAPLPSEVTHSEILESLMKPQQAQFKYINAAAKWSAHTRVHFLPFCFAGFFCHSPSRSLSLLSLLPSALIKVR